MRKNIKIKFKNNPKTKKIIKRKRKQKTKKLVKGKKKKKKNKKAKNKKQKTKKKKNYTYNKFFNTIKKTFKSLKKGGLTKTHGLSKLQKKRVRARISASLRRATQKKRDLYLKKIIRESEIRRIAGFMTKHKKDYKKNYEIAKNFLDFKQELKKITLENKIKQSKSKKSKKSKSKKSKSKKSKSKQSKSKQSKSKQSKSKQSKQGKKTKKKKLMDVFTNLLSKFKLNKTKRKKNKN